MTRTRSVLRFTPGLLALLLGVLVAPPVRAQQAAAKAPEAVPAWLAAARETLAKESYAMPPAEIARLATAPRHLNVSLAQPSPDRKYFLKEQSEGLPSVNTFGKHHIYLGGLQVDPKANRARALTTRGATGLQLIDPITNKNIDIAAPKGSTISGSAWAPDGKQIAFLANFDDGSQIFVADVATGKAVQVTKTPLLATLVTTIDWTADGKSVIAVLPPDGRKPEPKKPEIATGPQVRLWQDGIKDPERNYASLLQDPWEMEMLEYYTTGQIALIDVKTKAVKKIGSPAMIQSVDASPDGQYFRVSTMQKPFSYVTQYSSFGSNEELWDASGKVLATINKRALRLGNDTTAGGGRGGRGGEGAKRGLAWMPQGPGMFYIETTPAAGRDTTGGAAGAAGGGRAGGGRGPGGPGGAGGATRPDRLMHWAPPFGTTDSHVLYTADGPMTQIVFSDDAKSIFVASTNNGNGELYTVNLAEPTKKTSIVCSMVTASASQGVTSPCLNSADRSRVQVHRTRQ